MSVKHRSIAALSALLVTGAGTGVLVGSVAAAPATAAQQLTVGPNQLVPRSPLHAKAPTGQSSSSPCWASTNWSGYATVTSSTLACQPSTNVTYTSAGGSWKVPAVSPTSSASYSATWLGIDGFNNSSLIQTGTEQDYYSGSAHYAAWWTTSAQHFAEQPIAQPVKAGDTITARVSQTNPATHLWTITIDDSSWAQPFTTTLTYTGAGTSAEWIVEAPGINGRTATLAHYSTTTFTSLTANGGSPSLVTGDGGVLVQRNIFRGQVVSIPSGPLNGNEFAIAYGSTAPPAP